MHTSSRRVAFARRSLLAASSTAVLALLAGSALADSHTTGVTPLNSKPGAAYTLYLDFSGFNFTGGWGGSGGSTVGSLISFDSASDTGSFTSSELTLISNVWARSAEKYVGMNINVTTVDPAIAAGQAGTDAQRQAYYDSNAKMMHQIITSSSPSQNAFVAGGGVSWVGTTQYSYSTSGVNSGAGPGYHTNFVFCDQLANQGSGHVNSGTLRYIGEASAHENGHGLSLSHQSAWDGATKTAEYSNNGGSSLYAPTMGNSYGSARGLWRVGPTSAGSTSIQNDVQGLLNWNGGMGGFIDDGRGHSLATATPLSLSGGGSLTTSNAGYIVPASSTSPNPIGSANYTSDYYSFTTGGGTLSATIHETGQRLTAGTEDPGGTLDSIFTLLDSGGNVVTSVTNASTQSSVINAALTAGSYYLQVQSAGGKNSTGTETAQYYDMGSYFLTGSLIAATTSTWAVDSDGNWTTPSNWIGGAPNAIGQTANLGTFITSARTITLNAGQLVGTLNFSSPAGYTIAGTGTLILDVASGQAAINVTAGSHTIGTAVILNDDLTVTSASKTGLNITGNITATGRAVTKNGVGTMQVASLRSASLTINAGTFSVSPKGVANSPTGASMVQNLTIAQGAVLDLNNNAMVIDYTGASVETAVRQNLAAGWIFSSAANTTTRLGYGEATAVLGGAGTFAGLSVDATSVLIKFTYTGDANLDGQVDVTDLGALATNWQMSGNWTSGDFNYTGFVDVSDLGYLASNWQAGVGNPMGQSFSDALASVGLGGVTVPEPAMLGFTLLGLFAARRRRAM